MNTCNPMAGVDLSDCKKNNCNCRDQNENEKIRGYHKDDILFFAKKIANLKIYCNEKNMV